MRRSKELVEKRRTEIEKRNKSKISSFYRTTFMYDFTYTNLHVCVYVERILLKNDHSIFNSGIACWWNFTNFCLFVLFLKLAFHMYIIKLHYFHFLKTKHMEWSQNIWILIPALCIRQTGISSWVLNLTLPVFSPVK